MQLEPYGGARLLDFVTNDMTMSSYYQPLVIKSLIESGGRQTAEGLAQVLLLQDRTARDRALRILKRWPLITLRKRRIADYNTKTREFVLPVQFDSPEQRQRVIDTCTAAIRTWQIKEAPKRASQFYRIIEKAGGRCQACGIPGSISGSVGRPLDVDHIIPKAATATGKVRLPDGTTVPIGDDRNLQVLCTRCNRGKRDTSTYDFRPSPERLAETITLVLRAAANAEYDPEEILARAWQAL